MLEANGRIPKTLTAGEIDPGESDQLRAGDVIAERYSIDAELGRGGMGVVYAATNLLTQKRVAIKWMRPKAGTDENTVVRFLREAQAAGRVEHPAVVNIFDVGRERGPPFLVMELLSGTTLGAILGDAPIDARDLVALLLPALSGVAAAHAAGVIHRDLKPDNIFLCRDARGRYVGAKVLDFGISKTTVPTDETPVAITLTGALVGTPHYMSPEQLRTPKDVDTRTDIYAIGVLLYRGITGKLPFVASSFPALVVEIAAGDLEKPSALVAGLDSELESIVLRALARDRDDRYAAMNDLIRALEPFARGVTYDDAVKQTLALRRKIDESAPTLAHTPSVTSKDDKQEVPTKTGVRSKKPGSRIVFAVIAVLGVLAVGAAVWTFTKSTSSEAAHAPSESSVAEAATDHETSLPARVGQEAIIRGGAAGQAEVALPQGVEVPEISAPERRQRRERAPAATQAEDPTPAKTRRRATGIRTTIAEEDF